MKNSLNKITAYIVTICFAFMSLPVYSNPGESVSANTTLQAAIDITAENNETYSEWVYPQKAAFLEYEGVGLFLPAGSVKKPIEITIEKLSRVNLLPGTMRNSTAGAAGFRFGPHGTVFQRDIFIGMPYSPEIVNSKTALSNLFTYFFNEKINRWERLNRISVDKDKFLVTSRTNHFTDMVNTTLQLPDLPQGMDFDINSIKDLKAANPIEGIPQIQGLEADNSGAASFQIPLRVPQGRGEATPHLALSYNSESQNGWLGRGFDINFSQITTDTKFGLPIYTDSDTYVLDGENLVLFSDYDEPDVYRLRKEESFQQIRHYERDNYWTVASKDGSVRTYGTGNGWIGPNRSDRNQIYQWYITREEDNNGNSVDYSYRYDDGNRYTYLNRIDYSGYYSIRFLADNTSRLDRRIDSRGHFASKMVERLDRIEIYYNDSKRIRAYQFNYRINEFGQSQLESYTEEDGNGKDFYTYEFNYFGLNERSGSTTENPRYDAFSEEEKWSASSNANFQGLDQKVAASIGGSLYAGVQIWVPKIWGKKTIASFGVRGAVDTGFDFSKSTLMDLNGDGLSDMVWKDVGFLYYYPNQSGPFQDSNHMGFNLVSDQLSNVGTLMNKGTQNSFSLGVTGTLLGASLGISKIFSWSEGQSTFADVDADGYMDIVQINPINSSDWLRNNGNGSFEATRWEFEGDETTQTDIDENQLNEFQRTYYRQDPLRRWSVYYPGRITITNSVSLIDPSGGSSDGVSADTYLGNSPWSIELGSGQSSITQERNWNINQGDKIYFHLDPGDDERGDSVEWETTIKYNRIAYFNGATEGALFLPPKSNNGGYPKSDNRFRPIYEQEEGTSHYLLRSNWGDYATPSVYKALVENYYFIPQAIPGDIFKKIYSMADIGGLAIGPNSEKPKLLMGYPYIPEKDLYVRRGTHADGFITNLIRTIKEGGKLSDTELDSITYYKSFDNSDVGVYTDGNGNTSYRQARRTEPAARINTARTGNYGDLIYQNFDTPGEYREILLDRVYHSASPNTLLYSIWLSNETGNWSVYGEYPDQSRFPLNSRNTGASGVILNDGGLERKYTLSGKSFLLEEVSSSLYEQAVEQEYMNGVQPADFSALGLIEIPAAFYNDIYDNVATADERTLLDTAFVPVTVNGADVYSLEQQGLSDPDLLTIHRLFDDATIGDGITFNQFPDNEKRIILLSQAEYNSIRSYFSDALFTSSFNRLTIPGATEDDPDTYWYIPNSTSGSGALSDLYYLMYRDWELFPYYRESGGNRILRSNLPAHVPEGWKDIVSALWQNRDYYSWETLTLTIDMGANAILDVEDGYTLPSGKKFPDIAPGVKNLPSGSEAGRVTFIALNNQNRSLIYEGYVPVFNSTRDYDTRDMVVYPDDIFPMEEVDENANLPDLEGIDFDDFSGGNMGWFYNIWCGYHPFKRELIGTYVKQNKDEEYVIPNYTISVVINRNPDPESNDYNQILISETGVPPDTTEISRDAWIGEISSYSKPELDDNGNNTNLEVMFAPFIYESVMSPCRKGGDAFYNVPKGSSAFSGGNLSTINRSKSDATDVNGGLQVGPVSGNFSRNDGTSWQYAGLMDLNGDRYPDILIEPQDGGENAQYISGYKGKFTNSGTVKLLFDRMSEYDNLTFGFGATAGGGSAGMTCYMSDKARFKLSLMNQGDDDNQGGGASGSAGLNGTLGQGIQTCGLMDINGDGLPDHISRNGTGDFSVILNTGMETDWESATWSGGMDTDLADWSYSQNDDSAFRIACESAGLSYNNNGSYGATASLGIQNFGVNAGYTGNCDKTAFRLEDVNGDGLLDQVGKDPDEAFFRVRFNLGDTFSTQTTCLYRPPWNVTNISELLYDAIMEDLSLIGSQMRGLTLAGASLGIPVVSDISRIGNQFLEAINPFGVDDVLDYSSGVSINLGADVTFEWNWFLIALVLTPGVNGTYATTTTSLQFTDINGDGLPDHVMKLPREDFVRVKTNIMGKVGLLHDITLPFGGTISLDYQEQGNTEDMPQRKWVLSQMIQDDGRSGQAPAGTIHTYTTRFEYENGKYHRAQREFLGFQVVRTIFGDSSSIERIYSIKDVYDKGLVLWETFVSSTGSTLKETFNTYEEVTNDGLDNKISQFNALVKQKNRIVDPTGSNDIETQLLFQYSENGNITRLDDSGSTHHTDDDYYLTIEYASDLNGYRPGYPSAMEVFHGTDLIRKREGDYYGNGNLKNLRLYVTDDDYYEYKFEYDDYGNTTYKINPSGLTTKYTYDGQVHQFLTQIDVYKSSISTGYTSSMTWDYPTQTNLTRTDQNNQTETRTYDSHGRLKEIFSPYDVVGETPAVSFDYPELDAALLYSVTQNKLRFDPYDSQAMTTLTYCDGLGRIIQTAKQGETGYGSGRVTGWNVSGSLIFDAKGRTVQEGQNLFVPGSVYPGIQELVRPTTITYDQLDRVIRKKLPDGSEITVEYLFQDNMQLVRTTDPLDNITDSLTNAKEKIISIQKLNQSHKILTSAQYHYDALGRLTEALDHQGNPVRITYDMQGNRTSLYSHDTGLTEYFYNNFGLLSRKIDANLRHSGKAIDYSYDDFERLDTIDYPSKQSFEDTVYHYGAPGAPNNTAGRLVSMTYYAGSTSYEYGALGETTSMTRSIQRQTAAGEIKTATIGFTYDYLGRMETIDFPDGEVLTYQYDTGGQVKSASGTRGTLTTHYVREIGYDEYGQRIYIQLGNMTETYYTYDENRRWLNSILTKDAYGNKLQNISYQFNDVGNILGFDNTSDTYTTSVTYNYDDLYQLTRSEGVHTENPFGSGGSVAYKSENEQVFAYDSIGNVISKASQIVNKPQVSQGDGLNYALDYKYYSDKPHQPERIGNIWYLYDLNGNVVEEREGGHSTGGWTSGGYHLTIEDSIYKVDYGFGLERTQTQGNEDDVYMRYYSWDEENRLIETVEEDIWVTYCYDPSGQRTVKYIEGGETLYFDSLWSITEDYPDFRQSKHIYVGESRLATKMTIEDDTGIYYEKANTYYYHTDHLGSAQYITDPDGEVFEHLEYTPHGELWIEEFAESSGKIRFRFTGKELDEETGNYYMGARYLDPKRVRWISADPAGSELLDPNREDFNFLESLNWYVYCDNNPVIYRDPNGLAKGDTLNKFNFVAIRDYKFKKKQGTYINPKTGKQKNYNIIKIPEHTQIPGTGSETQAPIYFREHGKPKHREMMLEKCLEMAESGKYKAVYADFALRDVGFDARYTYSRKEPDIIGITNEGKFHTWEVASQSQTPPRTSRNRLKEWYHRRLIYKVEKIIDTGKVERGGILYPY
ncbi:MAG: hypothetical protein JW881_08080 [Spirochaetales bacterium]|nr:hypothetical protein [Spirochaetales bacterium]